MRDLSIIIPAFNEAERIGATLDSIASYLDERNLDDEVIVVDDGSTDDTIVVASGYSPKFRRLIVLQSVRNLGKGHAVRKGMLTGTGRHRLFLDADNSTNVRELDRLMAAAAEEPVEPAVVIGSVALDGSEVAVEQPGMRSTLGRMANTFIQHLLLPGIHDTQRGFKVFTGEASDAVFSRCTSNGWAFDVEALALAQGLGYHVLEVPITWEHRDDSRVNPGAYASALLDVVRIKRRVDRELASEDVYAGG